MALWERVEEIPYLRELFGLGWLERHELRGPTNIGAFYSCIGDIYGSVFWWIADWLDERPFATVVEKVKEFGREK